VGGVVYLQIFHKHEKLNLTNYHAWLHKKKAIYFKNMVTLFILALEQFSYILTIQCQRKVKIILCEVY